MTEADQNEAAETVEEPKAEAVEDEPERFVEEAESTVSELLAEGVALARKALDGVERPRSLEDAVRHLVNTLEEVAKHG